MLALEIRINDCEPIIAATDNLTFVKVSYGSSPGNIGSIIVAGSDTAFRYTWINEKAKNDDEIFIRVVDVEKSQISPPLKIEKADRELMLKVFHKLKKELQDRQLL